MISLALSLALAFWSHHLAENQQVKIGAGGGTRTFTTFPACLITE
jgi:hypothetical protein